MVVHVLEWIDKFVKDEGGDTQVEFAVLSTGVTVTICVVLKTLFRAFT